MRDRAASGKLDALTSLRFFAAAMIVFAHSPHLGLPVSADPAGGIARASAPAQI